MHLLKFNGRISLIAALLLLTVFSCSAQQADYVTAIASLSDPAKLATLGKRAANPRLKKIVYWLDVARQRGAAPEAVIDEAQRIEGVSEPKAGIIKANVLRNLKIADELGLLTPDNAKKLRVGFEPYVMNGPYAGEPAEVDHIIPFDIAPEIGNELANLELMPRTLNRRKSDKIGQRQVALAEQFYAAGMLSETTLATIKARQK